MLVPQFWAEGRQQYRRQGKQITVRRFGWSDASMDDAQRMADQRAAESLQRAVAGEKLPRRETKVAYNGAQGLPIREEIVARHGETVITRNSYGALCLNTPGVLFVDIDFREPHRLRWAFAAGILMLLALAWAGWATGQVPVATFLGLFAIAYADKAGSVFHRRALARRGGVEGLAMEKVRAFMAERPGWNLRIYRTPAGLRALATHQLFDPRGDDAQACFEALGADPVYVAMCRNQNCFRARVTAKPWRIGIGKHLAPRPGVWPVSAEKMPERLAWLANYERLAPDFAACRFVEEIGTGVADPEVRKVQDLHDVLCRAHSPLPIA